MNGTPNALCVLGDAGGLGQLETDDFRAGGSSARGALDPFPPNPEASVGHPTIGCKG